MKNRPAVTHPGSGVPHVPVAIGVMAAVLPEPWHRRPRRSPLPGHGEREDETDRTAIKMHDLAVAQDARVQSIMDIQHDIALDRRRSLGEQQQSVIGLADGNASSNSGGGTDDRRREFRGIVAVDGLRTTRYHPVVAYADAAFSGDVDIR